MAAADYRIMTDATGRRIAVALEAQSIDRAAKTDLTSISATGTTNTTGATIAAGTYFYLNGTLVRAKTDIGSGATFTNGTNYEAVTAGGLNSLAKKPFNGFNVNSGYHIVNNASFIQNNVLYLVSGVGPDNATFGTSWVTVFTLTGIDIPYAFYSLGALSGANGYARVEVKTTGEVAVLPNVSGAVSVFINMIIPLS